MRDYRPDRVGISGVGIEGRIGFVDEGERQADRLGGSALDDEAEGVLFTMHIYIYIYIYIFIYLFIYLCIYVYIEREICI